MYEEILRTRLKTLYEDMTCTSDEAINLVNFVCSTISDKKTVLKDIYFKERAPIKVLNPSYDIKGGVNDVEAELIAISEGYDQFVRKISLRTSSILVKHKNAVKLFVEIVSLPEPYARILYLKFFKGLEMDDIKNEMFISKSACYRRLEKGIQLLNERISREENT